MKIILMELQRKMIHDGLTVQICDLMQEGRYHIIDGLNIIFEAMSCLELVYLIIASYVLVSQLIFKWRSGNFLHTLTTLLALCWGSPLTKDQKAGFWSFLCCQSEQVEQTIKL